MSTATDRAATRLARWGYSQGSAAEQARVAGISRTRMSHLRTDEATKSDLAGVCRHVQEADDETARGILASVLAAYERRPLLSGPTPVLISRWQYLWEREHKADAEEDRQAALYLGGGCEVTYDDALRSHASIQLEMAEIRDELTWRGTNPRAVLMEDDR